jgi:glycosyltransferase involved in cell wall biosynthesis
LLLDGSASNYARKKQLFTGVRNMTLVVPSYWLESRVKQSFLKEYPVEVVYNTVNRAVFKPTEGDFRKNHQLEGKRMLLGVASIWEKRKGLEDFIQLAGMLDSRYRIVLVGLTEEQAKKVPDSILCISRTNNQQELAEIYTTADLLVNPSREETFGMTILEAYCCGTKSVVYEKTACEEVALLCGGIVVKQGVEHLHRAIVAQFPDPAERM